MVNFFSLYDQVVISVFSDCRSLARLIVVVNRLAAWRCHHDGLSLRLHCCVDVAEHLVAHHVHHRVDAAGKLLRRRLLLHHKGLLLLQNVDILRVIEVFDQVVHLHLGQALRLQEVLALVQVEAHVRNLLQEGLLFLEEVLGNGADLRPHRPHRQLLLDLASLLFRPRVRGDALLAHPVEQLSWHLHESLLGEEVRIVLEVVEGNELHDVRSHVLAVSLGVERLVIAVERLH